jgi:YebC/PmpR family DNA-binding regulatory protein
MSGHSKWSTIKRKKAVIDAKRGKVFTRILREVTVAAKIGGSDVAGNPRLRAAVQDAKANNVPNEKLERAIAKGAGELEGDIYEEISYEGYGPGGIAVLVETMTDNKNRTVSEVRHLFSKHGGNLGENGCVGWMFDQRGYFAIEPEAMDEDAFMELALDLDAEDIATDKGAYEIFTSPADYLDMKEALEARAVEVSTAQVAMIPQNTVKIEANVLPKIARLLDGLEDQDDVQNVWSNFEADDAALAALEG